jgi:nucleoside-diphosphate-sugar epimerase
MRVLLAGASGAIGRHLIPLLVGAGHSVTGITRRAANLSGFPGTVVVADILDRPALLAAVDGQRFDAVIHEATDFTRVPRRYSDMRTTNRLRTEGTSALLAAARATGATRFVAASVFYGYGLDDFGGRVVDEDAGFGEKPGGAVDAVFRSLLSNEQQVRAFGGVALRYGLFYQGRGAIPAVPGTGSGKLPFIHLEDAASATVSALDAPAGSVYNIVDDEPASWREVQEARAAALGERAPATVPIWLFRRSSPFSAEVLTATSVVVSNARAKSELGWTPRYPSYREGIAAAAKDAPETRVVTAGASRTSGAAHGSV